MNARALVLFPSLLIASASAIAQESWRGPYVGTVAGQPAVAMFGVADGKPVRGLFFYRRHGRDIALEPGAARGTLRECRAQEGGASRDCEDSPADTTGTWTVTLKGDRATGSWRAPKGDVSPRPIDLRLAPGEGEAQAGYERERLADNRIRTAPPQTRGPVTWRGVTEARSGARGLEIVNGVDPVAKARINETLRKMFTTDIVDALADNRSGTQKLAVVFANERVFTVTGEAHVWGGAHPSFGFFARTWDLATGQEVDFAKRLRLVDPSSRTLDLKRDDLLAAMVLRRAQLPPPKGQGGANDDGCGGLIAERYGCAAGRCAMKEDASRYAPIAPQQWTMYPTPAGLAVSPDVYNEAERGCRGTAIVVPWPEARRALLRGGPLP